jgi:hypothetical protein
MAEENEVRYDPAAIEPKWRRRIEQARALQAEE